MPSAKILEQKKAMVSEFAEKLKTAASGVLVEYTGITVEQDTALRAALRKAGVEYQVQKNTLTGRACEEAGYGEMKQYLTGMTAFAVSQDDAVAPAKILKEYADKIETFNIKAGFVDGAVVDQSVVLELAAIPSKEILVGKVLGSIQGPLYGLAYALQAIIDKSGESVEAPAAE